MLLAIHLGLFLVVEKCGYFSVVACVPRHLSFDGAEGRKCWEELEGLAFMYF